MDIELEIGDIIVDSASGEVGLLIDRYSLFDDIFDYSEDGGKNRIFVWAWEIYWTGPNPIGEATANRYHPYTEEGLFNLIKTGTFLLKKRG